MNREDIIRMAREAGLADSNGVVHAFYQLEYFAYLVAAAEREACAKLVEADGLARGSEGLVMIKAAGRIRARGEQ